MNAYMRLDVRFWDMGVYFLIITNRSKTINGIVLFAHVKASLNLVALPCLRSRVSVYGLVFCAFKNGREFV